MINIPKRYSQLDLRWRWKSVGDYSNFGKIGCTTTALTMLLEVAGYDLTPPEVEKKLNDVGGYLWQNSKPTGLLIWSKIQKAFPKVKFVYRYYSYDNAKVKSIILQKKMPVLVEVRHPSGFKHWVLFIGDYKAIDPLGGYIISTGKYPLTGFAEIIPV